MAAKKSRRPEITAPSVHRVLIVDGMNYLYRCRSGFKLGDHPVTYNFFRNLRALVGDMEAEEVIVVTEGIAERKLEFSKYKANRDKPYDPLDPESVREKKDDEKFYRQCDEILNLITAYMPIRIYRHPRFEADDVIYTLALNLPETYPAGTELVIVSNDGDFHQLLGKIPNLKIWNPMSKAFVEQPDFDHLTFKALKGDGSDNIPGIPGVGDVNAEKIARDPQLLEETLRDSAKRRIFERNVKLMALREVSPEELRNLEISAGNADWFEVLSHFKDWKFDSFFKVRADGTSLWDDFKATFEKVGKLPIVEE